jgi:hypothetical protein
MFFRGTEPTGRVPATLSAVPSKEATCRGVSPKSGSRPLGGEREIQPEPLPGRIFNPTIAAEGRQNVAEKGHSFSERREAEIEPPCERVSACR